MSQITYGFYPDYGIAGMRADAGDVRVESAINVDQTALQFGRGAAFAADGTVRNFYQETSVLTFSADLVADDDTDVSVNGEAITTVSYATSHADTMAAITAAIDGLSGVSATLSAAREITVIRRVLQAVASEDIAIVAAVTSGGAGTAVITTAESTDQLFAGLVVHKQNEDGEIANKEVCGPATQGVWHAALVTGQTPAYGGSVYVVSTGTNRGLFTTVDDTTTELVASAKFKGAARVENGVTLAKIEFNRP